MQHKDGLREQVVLKSRIYSQISKALHQSDSNKIIKKIISSYMLSIC